MAETERAKPFASEADSTTSQGAEWKAGKREWLIMLCLCTNNACVALDATIVVPPLPTIASIIGADASQAFWIGTAYLVPTAVSQLFIHGFSETFGRLPLLMFSIGCFTIGSIVAALAHHVSQMMVGRVVQGIGGGGIQCLSIVIITDITPFRQRPKFVAINQFTWALGLICGPLIGGALSGPRSWRWIFWLNLPFCGLGLIMAPLVIRYKRQVEALTYRTALAQIDWIGCSLFGGGLTSFLVGLSFGGQKYSWNSYHTLVALIVGAVGTVVALVWEARFAKHPFIKLGIYSTYTSATLLVTVFLQGFMIYLSLYLWNLYFQGVEARSPLGAGVDTLPFTASIMPASIITGLLIARFQNYRYPLIAGWVLVALGYGLVLLWKRSTSAPVWAISQIIVAFGNGIVLIATLIAIQSQVAPEHMTHATAMYAFLRQLGLSCGVSIGGTIFQNSLARWLRDAGLPAEIARETEGYLRILNRTPEGAFVTAVRIAIAKAHKNVFEVVLAFAALAFLLVLGVKQTDVLATATVEAKVAEVKDVEAAETSR